VEFFVRSPERLGAWPCGLQGRLRSSSRPGSGRTTSTAEKRVASIVLMASVANSLFPGSNGHGPSRDSDYSPFFGVARRTVESAAASSGRRVD
jgi:hypothetical protein